MKDKIRSYIPIIVVVCVALLGLFLFFRISDYFHARDFVITATGEESPDWGLVERVRKDFALMEKISITSSGQVEDMRINEDGTITYIDPIVDGVTDEFIVYKEANGNIVMEIWEGDLYNKMTLTPSGEFSLETNGE